MFHMQTIIDIIKKKVAGIELSQEEIMRFVSAVHKKNITDEEVSTMLLSFTIKGLTDNEIFYLANAIAHSGTMYELSKQFPLLFDKHSIGGFTDPATVMLLPIMMALDFPVVKISSSGFGEYARTIDRLRVFQGFKSNFNKQQIVLNLQNIHAVVSNIPADLVPVNAILETYYKKLNLTNFLPFIASSVMGKKIATGASVVVLDIKYGESSQIEDVVQAEQLASMCIKIGRRAGIKISVVITNANQPYGRFVGATLEMREILDALASGKILDKNFYELVREVATNALILGKKCRGRSDAYDMIDEVVASKKAYQCLKLLIQNQGGDISAFEDQQTLLPALNETFITAPASGRLVDIKMELVSAGVSLLGKNVSGTQIDPRVGFEFFVSENEKVKQGQRLAKIYYDISDPAFAQTISLMRSAFVITKRKGKKQKLIYKVII